MQQRAVMDELVKRSDRKAADRFTHYCGTWWDDLNTAGVGIEDLSKGRSRVLEMEARVPWVLRWAADNTPVGRQSLYHLTNLATLKVVDSIFGYAKTEVNPLTMAVHAPRIEGPDLDQFRSIAHKMGFRNLAAIMKSIRPMPAGETRSAVEAAL